MNDSAVKPLLLNSNIHTQLSSRLPPWAALRCPGQTAPGRWPCHAKVHLSCILSYTTNKQLKKMLAFFFFNVHFWASVGKPTFVAYWWRWCLETEYWRPSQCNFGIRAVFQIDFLVRPLTGSLNLYREKCPEQLHCFYNIVIIKMFLHFYAVEVGQLSVRPYSQGISWLHRPNRKVKFTQVIRTLLVIYLPPLSSLARLFLKWDRNRFHTPWALDKKQNKKTFRIEVKAQIKQETNCSVYL